MPRAHRSVILDWYRHIEAIKSILSKPGQGRRTQRSGVALTAKLEGINPEDYLNAKPAPEKSKNIGFIHTPDGQIRAVSLFW
jgi:hypothetical protein